MSKKANRDQGAEWGEARRRARAYARSLTKEEDAHLVAAANADPDALPLPDTTRLVSFAERTKRKRGARGPQKAPTKKLVSLRLDPDGIEHFRATGAGWQARINEALRKAAGLA